MGMSPAYRIPVPCSAFLIPLQPEFAYKNCRICTGHLQMRALFWLLCSATATQRQPLRHKLCQTCLCPPDRLCVRACMPPPPLTCSCCDSGALGIVLVHAH